LADAPGCVGAQDSDHEIDEESDYRDLERKYEQHEEHREQEPKNPEDELQGDESENGHEADCENGAKHDPVLPVEAIALPFSI
jgi:hypothetical protein